MQRVPAETAYAESVGYSRAVRRAGVIEVSGTTALRRGEPTPRGAYDQARTALEIVVAALEALGGGVADVVRTRIFVVDMEANAQPVGRAHAEVFGELLPASSMYGVSALIAPELLVEIEATALLEQR